MLSKHANLRPYPCLISNKIKSKSARPCSTALVLTHIGFRVFYTLSLINISHKLPPLPLSFSVQLLPSHTLTWIPPGQASLFPATLHVDVVWENNSDTLTHDEDLNHFMIKVSVLSTSWCRCAQTQSNDRRTFPTHRCHFPHHLGHLVHRLLGYIFLHCLNLRQNRCA